MKKARPPERDGSLILTLCGSSPERLDAGYDAESAHRGRIIVKFIRDMLERSGWNS